MPDLTFNTAGGMTIAREMLIAYLNTGTAAQPVWGPVGRRVEDSSTEIDWESSTVRDILGSTWGTLKKPTITQKFEPCDLDGDDSALVKLWNLGVKNQDAQALAALDMLIVHFYAGDEDAPFAERYSGCMVEITGLGGEGGGSIGMPFTVTYGGVRTTGTATLGTGGAVSFTPD